MTESCSLETSAVSGKCAPGRKFVERRSRDDIGSLSPAGTNYYDMNFDTIVHKIREGGCCVLENSDHLIMTTLGSCISVCIYDPNVRVGGMNHFLLPEENQGANKNSYSMRYGNNAMETLINEILKRGGQRSSLILKAFGAGSVINIKANIGIQNQAFLKKYVADERLTMETCDLGGNYPRLVVFYPSSGKAFVKTLRRSSDLKIGKQEDLFRKKIEQKHVSGMIELF